MQDFTFQAEKKGEGRSFCQLKECLKVFFFQRKRLVSVLLEFSNGWCFCLNFQNFFKTPLHSLNRRQKWVPPGKVSANYEGNAFQWQFAKTMETILGISGPLPAQNIALLPSRVFNVSTKAQKTAPEPEAANCFWKVPSFSIGPTSYIAIISYNIYLSPYISFVFQNFTYKTNLKHLFFHKERTPKEHQNPFSPPKSPLKNHRLFHTLPSVSPPKRPKRRPSVEVELQRTPQASRLGVDLIVAKAASDGCLGGSASLGVFLGSGEFFFLFLVLGFCFFFVFGFVYFLVLVVLVVFWLGFGHGSFLVLAFWLLGF